MKTIKLILVLCAVIMTTAIQAQTVAVAQIKTFKVYAHSSTVSKMVRMELIKLEKHNVLDEFDMYEVEDMAKYDSCFAKQCLIEYGERLKTDYIISGSVDKIGAKIIISLKLIDVKSKKVQKTVSEEFMDKETELQRMIGITVARLNGLEPNADLVKSLKFNNELITSNNLGRVNNSGPRMGLALAHGKIEEFMTRSETRGGMDMNPIVSNLGYQFEAQYVGTENFSALFEFIPSLAGLEQGKFIPSFSVMNGFRFGNAGWEFAFGPTFSVSKKSTGLFDHQGKYDAYDYGKYWSRSDLQNAGFESSSSAIAENGYTFGSHLDKRGDLKLSTRWLMAFGRTFTSGSLNIPVNVYYSSIKKGGMLGVSVGFNITRSKKDIKTY
jgi:TolB-like protein